MNTIATLGDSHLLPEQENPALSQSFDLTGPISDLPNLRKAIELPIDLMSDYWTPVEKNESKYVFFEKLGYSQILDEKTGDIVPLECAFFIEQDENGQVRKIRNGSKRLVGTLMDLVAASVLKQGAPLKITYSGKVKNKKGPNSSDNWSIRPLRVEI